jgi:hypothetical protein
MFVDNRFVKDWSLTDSVKSRPNVIWGMINENGDPVAVLTARKVGKDFSISENGVKSLIAKEKDEQNPLCQAYVVLFEGGPGEEQFVNQITAQNLIRKTKDKGWQKGTKYTSRYCWVDDEFNLIVNSAAKTSPLSGV